MALTLRSSSVTTVYGTNESLASGEISVVAGDLIVAVASCGVVDVCASSAFTDTVSTDYTEKDEVDAASHPSARCGWGIAAGTSETCVVTATFSDANQRKYLEVFVFNPSGSTPSEDFYLAATSGYVLAEATISVGNETCDVTGADAVVVSFVISDQSTPVLDDGTIGGGAPGGALTPKSINAAYSAARFSYRIYSATATDVAYSVTHDDANGRGSLFLIGFKATAGSIVPVIMAQL